MLLPSRADTLHFAALTMAGKLLIFDLDAAREYLASLDHRTRQRGEDYFRRGAVRSITCILDGTQFLARVKGALLYQTTLYYESGDWSGECSCPMEFDCKHACAAMLALLQQAEFASAETPGRPRALERALAEKLGRALVAGERATMLRIETLFRRRTANSVITVADVQAIFPKLHGHLWDALHWWPERSRDAVEFCQFLIHGLRERQCEPPEFLLAIADEERVGRCLAERRRQEQIEQWREQLETGGFGGGAAEEFVDVRLALGRDKALLEWRADGDALFQPLKATLFKRLADAYHAGRLAVEPLATPIWQSLAGAWDYRRSPELRYTDPTAKQHLNHLLRNPALADRIVTAAGTPLARPAERLRWHLTPAGDANGDYRLRLVTSDGTEPPPMLVVLAGRPTLYVTESAVFEGPSPLEPPPPAYGYGWSPSRVPLCEPNAAVIPALALETRGGVAFLRRLGVELPPRLQARTRQMTLKPKIFCELERPGAYSTSETMKVRVVAESDINSYREVFSSDRWMVEREEAQARGTKKAEDVFYTYDRAALAVVPGALSQLGARWDNYNGWYLRMTKKFPEVFVAWLASLPKEIEVHLDRTLATLTEAPLSGSVRLDVTPAGVDWFDLQVVLDVADTELTPEEIKALLNARGGYVRLGKKGWRRLAFNLGVEDDEQLARLGLNARDFSAEPQRLHALQLADDAAAKLLPEAQVAEIRRRASEITTRVAPPLPDAIRAELRPYQVEGYHFLAYLTANRFGGILADDMGLGKTLQTLTWLVWLRAQDGNAGKPSLVVCPKSVMDNWRAEAERFTPGLHVQLWHGADADALPATLAGCDLLVLNYAQLRSLAEALANVPWLTVILDEGQYIKNPESQTAHAARALKADHRLVLTGTPIENRLLDLWSLMAFAMPGVLGNKARFTKGFDQTGDPFARRRLAARVRPFVLRRTKGQVARDLPDRVEEDLHCEMEGDQQTLYRAEFKHAQQMLLKIKTSRDFDKQRFHFLTSLLRLRQICCHPALVSTKHAGAASAKLEAMADLLEPLMEEDHKVLVFSQFVSMLELLRPVMKERGWPHFWLTGDTEDRGKLVAEFQGAPGAAVFLISLKAGGFGLNLTAASYVVLFDPWWNPAVESQAIDRTHRIGQERKVIAYRLLIKDSIEEKIRALQRVKHALAEDVLGEENFAKSLTLDDLRFLFADDAP